MNFVTIVRLVALLPYILLAGCASTLNNDVKLNSIGNSAVIVMGVAPDVRLSITRGKNKSDGWYADNFQVLLHRAKSKSGYVVAKIPGSSNNRNYGVTQINVGGVFSKSYMPCGNAETITFDAPAGSVVFVGDFVFGLVDPNPTRTRGVDKAREFLRAYYPGLAPQLKSGNGQLLNVANVRCPRWYDYLYFPIVF